jgi:hypothetical protein
MVLEILSIAIAAGAFVVSLLALLRPDKDKRRMADALEKMAAREDQAAVDVQKLKEFLYEQLGDTDDDLVALFNEVTTGIARRGGTWILEPLGETRFSMLNGSDHDAFNVRLEVEGASCADGPKVPIVRVAAGEAVTFSVTRSWGADSAMLRVAWANDEAGIAQETWERHLT